MFLPEILNWMDKQPKDEQGKPELPSLFSGIKEIFIDPGLGIDKDKISVKTLLVIGALFIIAAVVLRILKKIIF